MKFAYLISAYTDAPHLKRLVEALHPDAHFFIHIDKKSDITPFVSLLQGDNIHFLEERVEVRWATITQVDFQMALIKAALDFPVRFDELFFLSGQDYPLWSNEHITRWMEEQEGREMLSGIRIEESQKEEVDGKKSGMSRQVATYQEFRPLFNLPVLGEQGNNRLSILYRKLMWALGRRKPLTLKVDGQVWHLYKGADYWGITQGLAAYVYKMYTTHPEIRQYFKDSFAPSETMIQTIAFNSPEWAKRCILWEGEYPGLAALTPLHFIIYEPVIKLMDEKDYEALMASGKMFTRKLKTGVSDQLVALLHERN